MTVSMSVVSPLVTMLEARADTLNTPKKLFVRIKVP